MRLDLVEARPQQNVLTEVSTPTVPFRPQSLPAVEVPGLYVHVPFCFHKCHYCDFYSITRQTPERMERFVDLLLSEADQWTSGTGPVCRPRTIFFGGGTPSLLPMCAMARLLCGLRDRFDFSLLDEWTVEVNPATASLEYCSMLREHGVDRLSFGAQSFDRNDLAVLERHHDPDDLLRSVEIARAAGLRRVNVDLIYAIPGQDLASWERSLHAALALGTEHLSCYGLTYEPNTPMAVKKRLGTIQAVDEDVELTMLHRTREILQERGYHPYEVSNYARSHEECRHNLLYWNGGSYVGLGPSAASHVEGHRWRNRPHLGEWESAVQSGGIPTTDIEHLTPRQRAGELTMLRLRLAEGISFETFMDQTGFDARELYADTLPRLRDLHLIELDDAGFRLSEKGLNVADAVAAEFVEV